MVLIDQVKNYYKLRGYKWPDTQEAMLWAMSELGESADELMKMSGGWTRNNPAKEIGFNADKFSEELGDTIMMLLIAGITVGKDPIQSMLFKMERKVNEKAKLE